MAEGYEVTNQRPVTDIVNGEFRDGIEIAFRTAAGDNGKVRLPLQGLTPEKATAAIEDHVSLLNGIRGL